MRTLLIALLLLLGATPAFAHAMLVHADPPAGAEAATLTIDLQFSEELQTNGSWITLASEGWRSR